jgi:MFS transporter, DHA2 family, multidrug resistance protein
VFLAAVPVMALLLALGPTLLPEFRDPEAGRLDPGSAALSLAAVLAVIYGLKQIAQDGFGWPPALSILAGLGVGAVFLRRQRILPYPLLDLRLFRASAFNTSVAAMCAAVFVMAGIFLFVAQYLQLVRGMGAFEAALWLLPSTAGLVVGSMLAPLLGRRISTGSVLAGGLALAAVGVAALTLIDGAAGLAVPVSGTSEMGIGAGLVGTLATDLVVGAAPPERAGAPSAISETGAELGGALGIAILGSIGTAVYRSQFADAIPSSVPPEQAEAAQDTLGGAIAAGNELPAPLAHEVVDGAREAFLQGLQLAAANTAVAAAGLAAAAAARLLRRTPQGARETPDQSRAAPLEQ